MILNALHCLALKPGLILFPLAKINIQITLAHMNAA